LFIIKIKRTILPYLNKTNIMKTKYSNLHDINTFMSTKDNETYFSGMDEYGEPKTIVFNTIELLEWLDVDHMKKQTIEYIKNL